MTRNQFDVNHRRLGEVAEPSEISVVIHESVGGVAHDRATRIAEATNGVLPLILDSRNSHEAAVEFPAPNVGLKHGNIDEFLSIFGDRFVGHFVRNHRGFLLHAIDAMRHTLTHDRHDVKRT